MAHDIFPITEGEAAGLIALDWNSGYGWATQFDWHHRDTEAEPERVVFVEDDAELMATFLLDLGTIRKVEAERVRKKCLSDAASVIPDLYTSEINFEVSTFFDGGYTWRLGDSFNGHPAEGEAATWLEVVEALRAAACEHFPDSVFASQYVRATGGGS